MDKAYLNNYESYWNKILSKYDMSIDNIKEDIASQLNSKFNLNASKDDIYVVLNVKYTPPFCISFYNNQLVGITAIRNTIEIEIQRG